MLGNKREKPEDNNGDGRRRDKEKKKTTEKCDQDSTRNIVSDDKEDSDSHDQQNPLPRDDGPFGGAPEIQENDNEEDGNADTGQIPSNLNVWSEEKRNEQLQTNLMQAAEAEAGGSSSGIPMMIEESGEDQEDPLSGDDEPFVAELQEGESGSPSGIQMINEALVQNQENPIVLQNQEDPVAPENQENLAVPEIQEHPPVPKIQEDDNGSALSTEIRNEQLLPTNAMQVAEAEAGGSSSGTQMIMNEKTNEDGDSFNERIRAGIKPEEPPSMSAILPEVNIGSSNVIRPDLIDVPRPVPLAADLRETDMYFNNDAGTVECDINAYEPKDLNKKGLQVYSRKKKSGAAKPGDQPDDLNNTGLQVYTRKKKSGAAKPGDQPDDMNKTELQVYTRKKKSGAAKPGDQPDDLNNTGLQVYTRKKKSGAAKPGNQPDDLNETRGSTQ